MRDLPSLPYQFLNDSAVFAQIRPALALLTGIFDFAAKHPLSKTEQAQLTQVANDKTLTTARPCCGYETLQIAHHATAIFQNQSEALT